LGFVGKAGRGRIDFRKEQDDSSKQRGELMVHNIPNDRIIDGKVGMGQDIPESGNGFPG
jgi:hypothetical protein